MTVGKHFLIQYGDVWSLREQSNTFHCKIHCYDHEFVIASPIDYDHGCVPIGWRDHWRHSAMTMATVVAAEYRDVQSE